VTSQPELARDILKLLERYRYRLPVRRFIYSLIDDSAFEGFTSPDVFRSPARQISKEADASPKAMMSLRAKSQS